MSLARSVLHAHGITRGDEHAKKVERIVRQLRAQRPGVPLSFRKRAVPHHVPKPHDKRYSDQKIDVRELDAILAIDTVALTCTAEPGVTFSDLVRETLKHGLVPLVVPELRTITVGGAVSGCSLESTSFKYGGFHDSCLSYEVIAAKGDVLECTPDNENRLVFEMMHGSFGTLGVLSKLTFRLVPAKPFVWMTYEAYATLSAYTAAIHRHYDARDIDFMDGIIHAPDHYVLSLGAFVDSAPYTSRYDWLNVYHRSTASRTEDYLRLEDYLFRYDNGVTNVHPKSALGRFFFGKLLHSDRLLRIADKLHAWLPAERPDVTLDTFIPFSKVEAFMAWYEREVGFFPLWCVPYKVPHKYEWLASEYTSLVPDELFLDLAIYGMKQPEGRNIYKEIEGALRRVNGLKTLISYNYYDPSDFWTIWNKKNYVLVKARTDPENLFRDLYSKTCRAPHGLADVPLRD
jgi:FAD/FMN-containing dehydrogenase